MIKLTNLTKDVNITINGFLLNQESVNLPASESKEFDEKLVVPDYLDITKLFVGRVKTEKVEAQKEQPKKQEKAQEKKQEVKQPEKKAEVKVVKEADKKQETTSENKDESSKESK